MHPEGHRGFVLPALLLVLLLIGLLAASSMGGLSLQRRALNDWYARHEAGQEALNALRECERALLHSGLGEQTAVVLPAPCQWRAADGRQAPHSCGLGERYVLQVQGRSRSPRGPVVTLLGGYTCPAATEEARGGQRVFGRLSWRRLP